MQWSFSLRVISIEPTINLRFGWLVFEKIQKDLKKNGRKLKTIPSAII